MPQTPENTAPAEGADHSAAQLGYLALLTDPANDPSGRRPTAEELRAELEEMESYEQSHGYLDVETIAGRLRTHYARRLGDGEDGAFGFWFVSDAEGLIGAYCVAARVGDTYCSRMFDLKHMSTDRLASGLDAALGYAEALDSDYQRLLDDLRDRCVLT